MVTKKEQVKTLRRKIQNDERGGSNADREILTQFSDQLELMRETYSWSRHEKRLRHCTCIAENVGGLAEALEDKEAAEKIARWIPLPGCSRRCRTAMTQPSLSA